MGHPHDNPPMTEVNRARVDAWCWAVRLFPTRSAAGAACRAGHVRVNGERAKPATIVVPGDEVVLRGTGPVDRVVLVQRLIVKRVGAPVAVACYLDRTPTPPPGQLAANARRDRGTGRPTKRDRRMIDKLQGL
jgi:ribosome-associated heat shock protein Hsp15